MMMNGYALLAHCASTPHERRRHLLGADAVAYATLRATVLYPSPTAPTGAVWAADRTLYGTGDVQNGRRRVQMNPGGTDYWVNVADIAPVIDVSKSGSGSQPSFVITDTPSGVATASEIRDITYRAEKIPGEKKKSLLPVILATSIGVLGLGATVALLAKSKWGWAIANFFLLTPAVVSATGYGALVLTKKGS